MITPRAIYREKQDFSGRNFHDYADFSQVVFEDDVDFSHATFEKGASFTETIFKKRANFRMCKCLDILWFWGSRFIGPADFHALLVVKDQNALPKHTLPGEANFSWARFHDEAVFRWARFEGRVFFWRTLFHQRVNFEGATFGEDGAVFNGTKSEVQLPYLRFNASTLTILTQERILRPDIDSPTIKFEGEPECYSLYLFGEGIRSLKQFTDKVSKLKDIVVSQQEMKAFAEIWHEGAQPMFQRPEQVCFDKIKFTEPSAIDIIDVNFPLETRLDLYKYKEIKINYTQHEDESADDNYWSCFISYSTKDAEFVKFLKERLRGEMISAWLDFDNITHGEQLKLQISNAVKKYDKLLIVLSKNSLKSDWVTEEINEALKKNPRSLFPIRITSVDEIKKYNFIWNALEDIPILDFEFDPETQVVNASFEDSFGKLVRGLKKPLADWQTICDQDIR